MSYLTSLYAAVVVFLFVSLSLRTLLLRRKYRVAVGTADSMELLRATRAHGRFAEYVPMALLLMLLVEMQTGSPVLIHLLGVTLVIGRSVHAYGVSQVDEDFRLRVAGMTMTFTVLCVAALVLVVSDFF